MKPLIDMNLSPDWVRVLGEKGFEALHQTMLNQFAEYLEKGALISIDEARSSVHILPLID